MQIGNYSLGQHINELQTLKELSFWEYLFLRKTFRREKIFRAPDISLVGAQWNLVLATIDGRIYKLSAQFMSEYRNLKDALFMECFMHITDQFGKAAVSEDGAIATWQTSFGNIILDGGSRLGKHYLNLQVTSGDVIRGDAPSAENATSPSGSNVQPAVEPVDSNEH